MSVIILPRRWTRQPTGPVEIDWSNPLARGLYQVILPQYGIELVSGAKLTTTGTRINPAPFGLACGFGTTFGVGTTDTKILATAGPVYSGPRSYLTQAFVLSGATSGRFFSRNASGSTAGGERFVIGTTDTLRLNRILSSVDISDSEWASTFGVPHTWLATNDGVTAANTTLHEDGKLLTRVAFAGSITANQASTDVLQIGNRGGSGNVLNGKISIVAIWNRELSAAEAREITRNPWQIFKPQVSRIYFDVPAASTFNPAWARNRNTLIQAGMPL